MRDHTSVGEDGYLVERREGLAAGARRSVPAEYAGFVRVMRDDAR